ncbi:MAG: YggT family protein [Pyrinomonadaceae bacterium]|nr:YggT family protein [Pyrinomonadaceae bacterium]
MLTVFVYPFIQLLFLTALGVAALLLILRTIFNYSDPNPFSSVGRFAFKIKKWTDKYVYPAARLLARFKIDTKLAPIVTLLIGAVITFFALQVIWSTFFIIDGLSISIASGNFKALFGFVLYAFLSALILLIFIRFISMWFSFSGSKFMSFVYKMTEPILAPARRIIPTVGMFDISAMIVLILIGLLQTLVLRMFVY